MLAGFRSRWMIPWSCAASSASQIWRAIGTASSRGRGPRAMRSASVGPSTSSSTSAGGSVESSNPWIAAMFGWLREASTCASRVKRARRSGSSPKQGRQDLQRDVAMQLGVAGAEDFSHPSRTERREDLVAPQPGSGCERHARAFIVALSRYRSAGTRTLGSRGFRSMPNLCWCHIGYGSGSALTSSSRALLPAQPPGRRGEVVAQLRLVARADDHGVDSRLAHHPVERDLRGRDPARRAISSRTSTIR